MPRINAASIDGRLAPHRVQTETIQGGGQERVAAKRLVEPGDGRRGTRQRVRESEVDIEWCGWRGEELVKHHAVLRIGADGPQTGSRYLKKRGFRHSGKTTLSLSGALGNVPYHQVRALAVHSLEQCTVMHLRPRSMRRFPREPQNHSELATETSELPSPTFLN